MKTKFYEKFPLIITYTTQQEAEKIIAEADLFWNELRTPPERKKKKYDKHDSSD